MSNQYPTNHAVTWFIAQIDSLREQIPTCNFSDVEFLRKANSLMSEIIYINADAYLLSYENVDRHAIDQILECVKKETLKAKQLIRCIALNVAVQPNDNNLLSYLSISLQSLSISLIELNRELKSDCYLPLFSGFLSNIEGTK